MALSLLLQPEDENYERLSEEPFSSQIDNVVEVLRGVCNSGEGMIIHYNNLKKTELTLSVGQCAFIPSACVPIVVGVPEDGKPRPEDDTDTKAVDLVIPLLLARDQNITSASANARFLLKQHAELFLQGERSSPPYDKVAAIVDRWIAGWTEQDE